MFFYETFGTAGVPKGLIDILLRSFEDVLGRGFSKLAIADPNSTQHYPQLLFPQRKRSILHLSVVILVNSTMVATPSVRPTITTNTSTI